MATKSTATATPHAPVSPADYLTLAAQAGEQFLTTLQEGQEAFLQAASTLAEQIPAAPAVPAVLPEGPSPVDVAKVNFDFAEKLLAQQKSYVEKLLTVSAKSS